MAIKYLKKASKTPTTDDHKTRETVQNILDDIGMDIEEFDKICDRFTNKSIFETNEQGEILKDENKRPLKIFTDY